MRKKFLVKQKYLLILKNKNKMKNLQEMSLQEMRKVEGGGEITFKLFGLHIFTVDGVADGVKGNSHWSWF